MVDQSIWRHLGQQRRLLGRKTPALRTILRINALRCAVVWCEIHRSLIPSPDG